MDHSSVGRIFPEWFKAPASAQSGCIKVGTDPNHWKKIIDDMEVWWCGKCFIKKTGTSGCWTRTNIISPVNTEEAVVQEIRHSQEPMLLLLADPLSLGSPKFLLWLPTLILQHLLHVLPCRSLMLSSMHIVQLVFD